MALFRKADPQLLHLKGFSAVWHWVLPNIGAGEEGLPELGVPSRLPITVGGWVLGHGCPGHPYVCIAFL